MALENEALILDLVEWIARKPRPYFDVMEAWRTSCPRLPNWEEAVAQKLVVRESGGAAGAMVRVTPTGRAMLSDAGRMAAPQTQDQTQDQIRHHL
ncbi:MAG: hypothetical protein OSB82_09430 [Alphaproteobacteria bacterium]|nr:hypothetical protein [Alphaproteobacteria bacterium]